MQYGIDFGKNHVIMRIKQRGKVGLDMKGEIRSTQSVSRLTLRCVMSVATAVRFSLAQLFFAIFDFWFTPMPI